MSFGLEQEGRSLIAPMALAHPLHLIDNRPRNRRRNLWLDDVFPPDDLCFRPKALVNIYICILYMRSVIGCINTYNRSVIQYWWSCTLFYRTVFHGGARFLGWIPLFVFFGLPIVSCSMINSLILECLCLLAFVLNNFLILGIWCSAISLIPGCFCPWTIFRISDSTWCHRTPLCHIRLLNLDILQGSFRLCNWLSMRRLVS